MFNHRLDKSSYGIHKGCYVDSNKNRLLPGFKYDLKELNSPERCIQYCLRIGFQLAGTFDRLVKSMMFRC